MIYEKALKGMEYFDMGKAIFLDSLPILFAIFQIPHPQ